MGVPMTVEIDGLTCRLTHGPSGASISTVPPRDNGGDGSTFSPTDLLAASLAACALSTLALVSAREGLRFHGGRARLEKEMSPPPRRVAAVPVVLTLPAATPVEQRPRLEEIARECPVARSLHPEVQVSMRFEYV